MWPVRERYGEAFWRAHHEAWIESELNQREYCEAYGIPLKAFGNWRAKFKAEPQLPARQVLYRRGGLSHALSHGLSHGLNHDLRPTTHLRVRVGVGSSAKRTKGKYSSRRYCRMRASQRWRRYGIAERVLFRWKQEATQAAASMFVAVQVTDGALDATLGSEECAS